MMSGLALVFGGLVLQFKDANSLSLLLQAFLLLLSGVVYPISELPTVLQWIAQITPLPWAIAVARKGFAIEANALEVNSGLLLPPIMGLIIIAVVWLLLGIIIFYYFAKRARITGSFGTF
jgi:ABC-type polysaccharide/polyol phosphate export permease